MIDLKSKKPVFIDLETYMDSRQGYSLSKMSDVQYIQDPRFHLLSVAIGVDNSIKVFRGDTEDWKHELHQYLTDKHVLYAHNSRFDFRVLKLRFGLQAPLLGDTLLMARYLGHPICRLAVLAQKILNEKKHEHTFDGSRFIDLSGAQWKDLATYNNWDVYLLMKLFQHFISKIPSTEMLLIDHTLRLCLTGNRVDENRMSALIRREHQYLDLMKERDGELLESLNSPIKIRRVIRNRTGFDPGTIDKKKVRLQEIPEESQKILKSVFGAKESRKLITDLEAISERMVDPESGAAYIDLNYSKAVTHRWSGGNEDSRSYNIQSMSKTSGVREIWVPDSGSVLSILDFAQIEVRVVAWFANEPKLLQDFREERCPYCEFGVPIFGRVLNPKNTPEDDVLRQICKQGVIGLSYGMGHVKFHEKLLESCREALEKAYQAKNFMNGLSFAKFVVDQYRQTFTRITVLPKTVYQGYQDAVTRRFGQGPIRIGHHSILILYDPTSAVLSVELPTGSTIYYRDIEAVMFPSKFGNGKMEMQISYQSSSGRKDIRFSTPIENVIQAMARDILGQKILMAEDSGYSIRTHTHDEIVAQLPKAECLASHSKLLGIFEEPLTKFPDLPLSCKGFVSDRYTKDENYMKSFMADLDLEAGTVSQNYSKNLLII